MNMNFYKDHHVYKHISPLICKQECHSFFFLSKEPRWEQSKSKKGDNSNYTANAAVNELQNVKGKGTN